MSSDRLFRRATLLGLVFLTVPGSCRVAAQSFVPTRSAPPAIPREFRGAWVATVHNIDWPSRSGLSASRQKAELVAILNKMAGLRMNAVIFQVRPACDALYASSLEPWSPYLTGRMGASPGYDPLQFAVQEAHRRGMELHAWFNPFRALASSKTGASSKHITRTRPAWVRRYQGLVWLDPGLKAVREHAIRVITDVVKRYDIDGVHLDDYFYPYPKNPKARPLPQFPDNGTYKASKSRMSRDDWRRVNIDSFVAQLYRAIKSQKSWVKFGISPFGIWRPNQPRSVQADLDAYGMLYADSRKWLASGWVDYFSPQLYWTIRGPQSFSTLLGWWDSQNGKGRHIWPGIASSRIGSGRPALETGRQIQLTRSGKRRPSAGHVHWSVKAIMRNQGGVSRMLAASYYTQPALVPASPWLKRSGRRQARLTVAPVAGGNLEARWRAGRGGAPRFWVVQTRTKGEWSSTRILPGGLNAVTLPGAGAADAVALTAVDRYGNAGPPAVVARTL